MKLFSVLILALVLCGCAQNKIQTSEPQTVESIAPPKDERALQLIKIKEAIVPFFEPMRIHSGDWLKSFKEGGQTFEEYLNANPTLPTAQRRTIYIQPIGEFTRTQQKILRLTAEYMKAFYKLPVTLQPVKSFKNVPKMMIRNNPFEGQRQIKTAYFLENLLPQILPDDAAAFICFTSVDLYPDDKWNYVFGQASLEKRVGVWSLWRFGNPDKGAEDYKIFLSRTLKVAMHETGHMFSMAHCTKYECLMSGSNHIIETDRRPLDVCPECMAKIAWAMNYESAERYRKLAEFWKKQNWIDEEKSFEAKAVAVDKVTK